MDSKAKIGTWRAAVTARKGAPKPGCSFREQITADGADSGQKKPDGVSWREYITARRNKQPLREPESPERPAPNKVSATFRERHLGTAAALKVATFRQDAEVVGGGTSPEAKRKSGQRVPNLRLIKNNLSAAKQKKRQGKRAAQKANAPKAAPVVRPVR